MPSIGAFVYRTELVNISQNKQIHLLVVEDLSKPPRLCVSRESDKSRLSGLQSQVCPLSIIVILYLLLSVATRLPDGQ